MLEQEIGKLGLSDKEAKVYLASLELGPSPVQVISQKAKVNRATTYVIIDSLMEMGLMSTYEEGKRTFFTAEPPERIMTWLQSQETEVKDKIKILEEKMPELRSLVSDYADRPKVKYFEGFEGLRAVQNDFMETLKEGDCIFTFLPYDEFYNSQLRNRFPEVQKKRVSKNIRMRIIYTSKYGRQEQYEKEEGRTSKEYRYIDGERYPFHGGMNIYGNKIFMIDYKGKTGGVVIENITLAKTLAVFFELIWDNLKK